MLGLRPIPWKAVGLTAAIGQLALRGSTRRGQGRDGMRAPQTKPSGSTRGHKEGATRGKERKPFSDYTKKEKSTGLTTSEAICAKGGNPQEWKGIPPANPGGPRRDRTSGGKEGPFPIRTWSLCKESPVGRNCCAGRSCRTQPTIANGRLGQADDGVRLEDLNNPDRVEGALLALRIRGGGDGEGPGKAAPPVKEEKAEDDKNRKEGEPPKKGPSKEPGKGDPPPGDGGEGKDHEDRIGLKYAPVCCSCSKQGVDKVQHTGEMDTWPTFATRPIRKGSKTLMGVCLMPAPHGLIRSEQGRLCGHTPCMQCAKKKQEKIMCLCCATRLEVLGAGKGGAGPLPKPVVQRRSTSRERSRTPPRGTPADPPRRGRYSDSESDSDRRSNRWDAGNPSMGVVPSPRSPPGREGLEDRRDRERRPEDEMEEIQVEYHKCAIQGCKRPGRGPGATCCDPCGQTGGQKHSRACNNQFGPVLPPRERDRDDDDDDDGDDEYYDDHRRKGSKGKGKGKAKKSDAKAQRDRDRWRSWEWNRRGIRKSWNPARFARAMTMGRAASTLKCTESRLCTWDRVMKTLEEKEVIPRETLPGIVTAERLKAGVACLKSQGYRSAELYMSAALLRHRVKYGQSAEITMACKDATRMARRGRGPPAGKQPVPIPKVNAPYFEAVATGIWYLLRVGELAALNVEDVLKKQSGGKLLVALWVRASKTDQEGQGEMVARECTCGEEPDDMCPAHLLWDQVTDRRMALQKMGSVEEHHAPVRRTGGQPDHVQRDPGSHHHHSTGGG